MATLISPGVSTTEVDQTTTTPAVATSTGAIAGVFRWGPIGQVALVNSEDDLVGLYGAPTNLNPETFFAAADFLAYSNGLYVSRAANTADNTGVVGVLSAVANTSAVTNPLLQLVLNDQDYLTKKGNFESEVLYIGRYPGAPGNSLRVSVCDSANQFQSNVNLVANAYANVTASGAQFGVGSNTANIVFVAANNTVSSDQIIALANTVLQTLSVGDLLQVGNSSIGQQVLKVASIGATQNTVSGGIYRAFAQINLVSPWQQAANVSVTSFTRNWEFYNVVSVAPTQSTWQATYGNTAVNDELHIVVVDQLGQFSGTPGGVLETYENLSRATDAQLVNGTGNYYASVINSQSEYIRFANDRSGAASNTAANLINVTTTAPLSLTFQGGSDGAGESNVAMGDIALALDHYRNAEDIDVSLIIAGKSLGGAMGELIPNYIISNIAEARQDCVVFISSPYAAVVNVTNKQQAQNCVNFRNLLTASTYAVLDSGYKYRYDKYNDVYRYTPLCGDIAGLCARTDNVADPWWSPAGFNRGQILNLDRLAWNPGQSSRDLLYKNGINPVVSFPGQGTVLYGDKTLSAKPSAFDRINVRRLFIVLKKTISIAAQSFLFEFNDAFSQAAFKAIVNPYLNTVLGRRGITDFLVVCDSTNNPPEVVMANQFVGDIYIKPNYSINFINLNFIAVRSDVTFSEAITSNTGSS